MFDFFFSLPFEKVGMTTLKTLDEHGRPWFTKEIVSIYIFLCSFVY